MALAVHGERVEHLVAAEPDDDRALLAAVRPVRGLDLAGPGEPERPAARGRRLDHVERPLVGREPDAVRALEREDGLLDHRAVGLRVVDGAAVGVALARLAEVGEPEAARAVEDEVVRARAGAGRRRRRRASRTCRSRDRRSGCCRPRSRRPARSGRACPGRSTNLKPAVVGDVDLAARAHGRAVRAAAERGDHVHLAVGRDARERVALDLDQDDRAVRHRHRPLGKAQPRRDLLDCWRLCRHGVLFVSSGRARRPCSTAVELREAASTARPSGSRIPRFPIPAGGTVSARPSVSCPEAASPARPAGPGDQ